MDETDLIYNTVCCLYLKQPVDNLFRLRTKSSFEVQKIDHNDQTDQYIFYHCHNIDHAGGNAVNDKIYAGHQVCGHPGLKFHHCFVKMRHDRLFQRWIVLEQFGKPQRQVIDINGKAVLKSQDTVQYLRNNHPEQTGDNKYKKEQAYQSGSHLPYTVPDLLGLKQPYSLFADKRIGKIIDRKHQIGQNASVDNRHQNLDDHTDHSEDIRSL